MEYNSTPPQGAPPLPHYNHPFCCYHQNPNPNPAYHLSPAANEAGSLRPLHHPPPPTANPYTPYGGCCFPHHLPAGPTPPPYYHCGAASAGGAAGWFPAAESTGQYGSPPAVGYGPPIPPRPSNGLGAVVSPPALPAHWRTLSYSGGTKKRSKKTTKVVQSAYCEVCKVNCTCEEDLNSHKQGKKHIKQLQKLLQESTTPKSVQESTTPKSAEVKEPAVGSKGKAVATGEKKRKKALPATEEDLETKKKKLLECGAAPEDVRVCTICHVVVNSQAVYDTHVAGQKHIANVKQQEQEAVAAS
ncbi:putative zinc finger RNA-binding protein [Iris pallida]|uniref:Zinc finger RNA-binding protein n=1 Tax=Iris pallida TaxID=29817 RepID=A0AAX6HZQ0_IRIPA|nr:putative zinc finger RNA-binding protein [Iris pallida]